jgi:hypothetical protein
MLELATRLFVCRELVIKELVARYLVFKVAVDREFTLAIT